MVWNNKHTISYTDCVHFTKAPAVADRTAM